MTADTESGMSRVADRPARKAASPAIRRWRRLRSAAIVLATQGALLAVLLGFWDHMTANNKQAAYMSALAYTFLFKELGDDANRSVQ